MRSWRKKRLAVAVANLYGSGGASALLDSSSFYAQLTHSLVLSRGTGSPTFTRATTATFPDNEGILRTAIAGEARFVGARRVRNLIAGSSEDLTNASWTHGAAGTAAAPTPTAAYAAGPLTGSTASRLQFNVGAGTTDGDISFSFQLPTIGTALPSVYLKSNTGAAQKLTVRARASSTANDADITVGTDWERFDSLQTGGTGIFVLALKGSWKSANTADVLVSCTQLEDITGRTDQTTPSEYVSVGVVQRNIVLNSSNFGATWAAVGTPTRSAAAQTTQGVVLDLIGDDSAVALEGYTQTIAFTGDGVKSLSMYVKAGTAATSQFRIFDFTAVANRVNCLITWTAGVPSLSFFAGSQESAPELIADGVYRIKVVTTAITAANTNTLQIYPATNGLVVGEVGNIYAGGVQAENNATATAYQDVAGSYIYHGAGVDGVEYFNTDLTGAVIPAATNLGYMAEAAATNLCLQSNAFTTTWIATGTPSATQNAIGPDGAISAWTLTDNDAGAYEGVQQAITLTAANYTNSVFVKKTTGAQASYPVMYAYKATGSLIALCTIDTSNGVATVWTAYTGLNIQTSTARCSSYNADYWRVELTFLATAAAWDQAIFLAPAGTTNATQSTGTLDVAAQGSAVFYGAQVELGSAATSYQATTTGSAVRNADIITFPTAGNVIGTSGAIYAEGTWNVTGASGGFVDTDSTGNRGLMVSATSGGVLDLYDGTTQNNSPAAAVIRATPTKVAATWGGSAKNCVYAGTLGTPSAFDGNMNVGANMSVGIRGTTAGAQNLNGTIRNVRIWQRALSSSELQAITR